MIYSGIGWSAFKLQGERKRQCDAFRVLRPWGPDDGMLALIADGHGRHGYRAARLVVKKLPRYLRRSGFAPGLEKQVVRQVCVKLDREVKQWSRGGTTLTLAYLSRRYSFIAWIGDSPAFRITKSDIEFLIRPHNLLRTDEVERLRRAGADILERASRPVRIVGEQGYSINITRTIGDACIDPLWRTEMGLPEFLIPEPEFMDDQDRLQEALWIMLASDGVINTLDEACVPSCKFRFLYQDRTLSPPQMARRFRDLVASAQPSDNATTAFAQPNVIWP